MSRMKRKADAQPKDKVILVENGNSDCNSDEPVANSLKRRWLGKELFLGEPAQAAHWGNDVAPW
ncbi:hypothetical protein PCASD_12177 [Puccinia coronata f. sp. avenae]|uniref:Uncharacterized protein n=1 Tax=Puccinia coronata f. sp. avenae TaxID=200324 RepID=A0A2N5UIU4_9BASI|nr:hypothetical protein PCASD_12177 [Puccinia coronata f. sp. avenae]